MRRRLYRSQDYCYHLDAGLHGLGVGAVAAAVVECTAVVGLVVGLVVVDAAAASDASVAFAEVDAVVVGLAAEHAALAFVVFEAELVLVFEIVAAGDD
jgi:hypothetical protein